MDNSPRSRGFNYGVGWGPTAKPPIYYEAQQVARELGKIAIEASRQHWSLEMAIRDVRLAETDLEKKQSVTNLSMEMARYKRKLQAAE